MRTDWREWLSAITQDPVTASADKAGLSQSYLNRQLSGARPMQPETVIALSRAYGQDPLEGLVELGILEPHEVERRGPLQRSRLSLITCSDDDLMREVRRRIDREQREAEANLDP